MSAEAIEGFAKSMKGRLVQPGDADYDEARATWNGMVDKRPALIARCESADDVIAALAFAREQSMPLVARGGGHSVAGRSSIDDGVVIDLGPMNQVTVDPKAKTALVGAGATWGDFDAAAQTHGLATTGGVDSRTGVAGLTLGGGYGHLGRRFGMACDNLVALDLVGADGRTVRASEDDNPDLFWALRGGSGNLGIVTSFEFRLHEVGPEVLTAQVFYRYEHAADVLRFYRGFIGDAPDELTVLALALNVPPAEPFPEDFQGQTGIALVASYSGSIDEGRKAMEPLDAFGDPAMKVIAPMPYTVLQSSFNDGFPAGARYYWKSHYIDALPDDAIEVLARHGNPLPGAFSAWSLEPMGGAINRVDASATAFPHRDAAFNVGIYAGWEDPSDDDSAVAWARSFHEAMEPYGTGSFYVNYADTDEGERADAAWGANRERLERVKATYDPDGVFSGNVVLKV